MAKTTTRARKDKPARKAATAGRPSAYKPEFSEQARKLCLLGATDVKMAEFFGVCEKTLNTWKAKYPEFLQSITQGKEAADAEIAESLFHRAKGYSHPEVHVSNYQGAVTLTPLTKHYPPDTPAASLWLRNRQPRLWRDKMDLEMAGKDGGPIQTESNLNVAGLSADQLRAIASIQVNAG